ncbi:hypothetical protein DUI87_33359 [Hirundo rustica rustica]|uniref:Uncharacterized protein n=1 Tax=Hirundo rustica rustica TaxID=333673 RepID=A0A3M0ITN2_HIRRU|nr:hypothetical protein DUI87_33359 [Hirundo rustica rustica]
MYDQARAGSAPYPERQKRARSMIILQDSSHLPVEPTEIPRPGPAATPPEKLKRKGRVIDNPYANMGQFNVSLFAPAKPQRKKSPLVKQLQVEDAQERAALAITGGYSSREPSPTRRSHRLEYQHHAAGIAQVEESRRPPLRHRHRRRSHEGPGPAAGREEEIHGVPVGGSHRRPGPAAEAGGGGGGGGEMPSLQQQSRSIDERLLGSRDVLLPAVARVGFEAIDRSSSSTFIHHPLTESPWIPNSPLALALAARERALVHSSPIPSPTPIHSPDSDRAAPLFVDIQTKEPDRGDLESLVSSPAYSPGREGGDGGRRRRSDPHQEPLGDSGRAAEGAPREALGSPRGPRSRRRTREWKRCDTRSSSDHHLETTSTISTVSSMSTLSSESGEPTDTYTSFADGPNFSTREATSASKAQNSSPSSARGPVTFRDPLLKQSSDSELISPAPRGHAGGHQRGPATLLFQRRSKLWGDPMESRPGHGAEEDKPTVISELSSRLQQLNKDTRSLGEGTGRLRPWIPQEVAGGGRTVAWNPQGGDLEFCRDGDTEVTWSSRWGHRGLRETHGDGTLEFRWDGDREVAWSPQNDTERSRNSTRNRDTAVAWNPTGVGTLRRPGVSKGDNEGVLEFHEEQGH